MPLARFSHNGRTGDGAIIDGTVHLLGDWRAGDDQRFPASRMTIAEIETLIKASCERFALETVKLECPIDERSLIICAGVNYQAHVDEAGRDAPTEPSLFLRHPRSLVGPADPVVVPDVSEAFDYEGELAVVIGAPGRHIARENAMNHVLGYTCFMDGSVRDYQFHSATAGKNFWRSGSIGPAIVTRLKTLENRKLETKVDGVVVQSTTLDDMIFDIPALIEYCSRWTRLSPGDVIATGTPGGVGHFRKPQLWLKAGGRVEVLIDGVGHLTNAVVAE